MSTACRAHVRLEKAQRFRARAAQPLLVNAIIKTMNPRLDLLHPYPFERLRKQFATVTPNAAYTPISFGIGEPQHATPAFIQQALADALGKGLSGYPATAGDLSLRQACADWAQRRYGIALDAATQVLPVNGSREALFAFAQAVIDDSQPGATVVCPNPFYQIYEGATLLAGATPYYAPSDPARNFGVDWNSVPDAVWANTQLVFVCSPGNPTGAVMPLDEWQLLFDLSDKHGFVIASDECYSEIYFQDEAPLGGLQAAQQLGRSDFKRLVLFTSLSKRSNVPGMRSGFVAGDAELMAKFLLYRTYHGSAMGGAIQAASAAAWGDEAHVVDNRAQYKAKFDAVTPLLADVMDVRLPDAGFYLWAGVPAAWQGDDVAFASELLAKYNVTVLPGSYLARAVNGVNPGQGRVRIALVAETERCVEGAKRLRAFCESGR